MTLQPTSRVWRYMSFAKFVWLLQTKQLWLSSTDLLDDKWEVMPDTQQLNAIINKRPASISAEKAKDMASKSITELRKKTFINCWTASEHESQALWRIYCPTPEGVAIQTTFERLNKSVGGHVFEVSYDPPESNANPLEISKLVVQKRPAFAYEQEVRIVIINDFTDPKHPERKTVGMGLGWDPELHVENIFVHPESQFWFIETVTETVRKLAPKISNNGTPRVWYSKLSTPPPF